MNKIFHYSIVLLLYCSVVHGQNIEVQPYPKIMEQFEESVILSTEHKLTVIAENKIEKKAVKYFQHLIDDKYNSKYKLSKREESQKNWSLSIDQIELTEKHPNSQHYKINFQENIRTISISSPSQLGLLYGVVTLSDLIFEEKDQLKLNKCFIEDYPTYQRRMFVTNPKASDIPSLLNSALLNKFETVVLASRQHAWYELSDEYMVILKEIKKWKDQYGGPKIMQSHNIYEGRDIVISDNEDIESLKKVILTSYEHGIEKLMILSDDTPPFKFGEGYILTNKNDKKKFKHFEAANVYLMNKLVDWFKENNMEIESYYVPAFYTYEEMHQGDMSLFIDTPWEEDAFNPFYRDLNYIGSNINSETFIIWCGPNVRSRKITENDLNNWTNNLNGRVPFLWDNTIYSHHPFTSTPLLTSWDNELPNNFFEITDGNGMFINGDANSESTIVSAITTNDYLWNPETYNPDTSLETAVQREYGSEVSELVLKYKNVELELRKTIGARKLWFETDTLWQQIRNIRFITDKNPFYYHLNYSRLKTLRLQLKESVSEPESKELFVAKCKIIQENRNNILARIKEKNKTTYFRLKSLAEPIPDFNSMQ